MAVEAREARRAAAVKMVSGWWYAQRVAGCPFKLQEECCTRKCKRRHACPERLRDGDVPIVRRRIEQEVRMGLDQKMPRRAP